MNHSTPSSQTPMIRLAGVHKAFGPVTVLRNINLDFHTGQTAVILGPSGTGKSVLLKHIVGLLRPDRGEIWFEGQRIDLMHESQLVAIRKKIGFLFQMGALFDSMSVRENICFPLVEHTRLTETQQNQRCASVLQAVGLEGLEDKMPASLSGGQRKRVALARAIVLEPQVMFYDEPTTGLDPIRADVINELILSLARKLGMTSIVVTHDMVSARKIADRMLMLYEGQIIADDTPENFLANKDPRVQQFIQGQADPTDLLHIRQGLNSHASVASPEAD